MRELDWPDEPGFWWCKFFHDPIIEIVRAEQRDERVVIGLPSGRWTVCYPDCKFVKVKESCPWE